MILDMIQRELERVFLPDLFYRDYTKFEDSVNLPDVLYHYIEYRLHEKNMIMPYKKEDFNVHKFTVMCNDIDIKSIEGYQIVYPKPYSQTCHYQAFITNKRNDFRLAYGVEASLSKSQVKAKFIGLNLTDNSPYNPFTNEDVNLMCQSTLVKYNDNKTWSPVINISDDNLDFDNVIPIMLQDYINSIMSHYIITA